MFCFAFIFIYFFFSGFKFFFGGVSFFFLGGGQDGSDIHSKDSERQDEVIPPEVNPHSSAAELIFNERNL